MWNDNVPTFFISCPFLQTNFAEQKIKEKVQKTRSGKHIKTYKSVGDVKKIEIKYSNCQLFMVFL